MNPLSEEQIVEGLRTDNHSVLTYLYKEYRPGVGGIVLKNSGDEEDANDLFQSVMLKVWKNVKDGSYEHTGRFRQYFFSVAYNDWLYELRKRKSSGTIPIGDTLPFGVADNSEQDIFIKIVKEQSLTALHNALKQIGENCRSLLTLFHLEELSSKELADKMNTSDGYIRKRLHDCRQQLKNLTRNLMGQTNII